MLVYRVEDRQGKGAFAYLFQHHDKCAYDEKLRSAIEHPSAYSHSERNTALNQYMNKTAGFKEHRFACRSKPQLRMWFRSARGRQAMADFGGMLVTYAVDEKHIHRGRYQLVFDPNHATEVSRVPVNEL